jgi:PAS domain S-box-containing protein
MPIASSTLKKRPSERWVPWFVLLVGLAVTVFSAWYIAYSAAAREQARFHGLADAAVDQLDSAMDDYTAVLRGVSGMFAAVGNVDARQFNACVQELDLPHRYPALRGVGYAPRVAGDHLAAFTKFARAQMGPTYAIWPPDVQSEAFPNLFSSPRVNPKHPGRGFNILSDETRRVAMWRACDTGEPASTARLHLFSQALDDPVGAFLIYMPIFPDGKVPATVDERRGQLAGAIFVGFRADEFFEHIFDSEVRDRLAISVFDKQDPTHEQLFDPLRNKPEHPGFVPHLSESRVVAFAGRSWTLQMTERQDFDIESGEPFPPFILLGGIGISLVLFAVTRGQSLAQASAERSAAALKRSAEALQASQARIRRLVDSNLIGVFFCNLDGTIGDGNDEFFRLIGRPRGQTRFDSIVPADDLPAHEQAFELLRSTGVCPQRETSFVHPDGSVVPVLIGLAMVDGSATEAVAFTIDLTERKRAERELRSAKEAAEAANKSKDQFLAVLSHELRTPLTPVLAVTTAARDNADLSPEIRGEMAMIHRNVELEAKLIDDLLDLTRIGRGKLQLQPETVDVHRVIAAAIEVSSSGEMASKKLSIEQDLAAEQHYVRADPARLQQIFWNLLKNAAKFTPAGGRITIRTFADSPAPEGPYSFRAEVSDTGLGIEADLLPKIFDAFEQGSIARAQASGGLGLGLAISRGLVEAHGGEISARSEGKGRGATFTVRLPAIFPLPDDAAVLPAAPAQRQNAGLRILLVEDHADTAHILARLLRMGGHQVQVGNCVADAAQLVSQNTFDLLVSDLGLPDGSGIDVIRCFREHQDSSRVRAIALTGYGAEMDVARTTAAGFDEHLTKPISFQHLQQAIERVSAATPADSTAAV